nr:uncharacterized protein LOC107447198 [Parasteatoda tepidariorum]
MESEERIHCGFIQDNTELNKNIEKFWDTEEVQCEVPKNKEAIICKKHFEENVKRDKTGRYIVKMPLKDDPRCLGKSKDIALKKLNSLWNQFLKDPEYLALYRDFLGEYETLDHMTEVSECEEEAGTYYIPHLGIYLPDKMTTKLRVMFNASSPTTLGTLYNITVELFRKIYLK